MKRNVLVLGVLATALIGCKSQSPPPASPGQAATRPAKVRPAAVAGMFYPNRREDLQAEIDKHLAKAPDNELSDLRAIVCPHAGYEYSGPVAACAYRQLRGRSFKTVIVLAGSHYAMFPGGCMGDHTAWATPLGEVPLSGVVDELDGRGPFARTLQARVQRPDWWRQSPAELPPFGQDTPVTWEHSLEVQVPFLQRVLGAFELVPVVFGEVEPAKAADVLDACLDAHTLIVASTDLSHFLPAEAARARDTATVKAICDLKSDAIDGRDACGHAAVKVLLELARRNQWQTHYLDYRNSGDTAGNPSRVVGYAAIAFTGPPGARKPLPPRPTRPAAPAAPSEPAPAGSGEPSAPPATGAERSASQPAHFPPADRRALLALARRTVQAAARGEALPDPASAGLSKLCDQPKGCFVTLNRDGRLRGCIGNILPQPDRSLGLAVVDNAVNAALRDHRFRPVTPDEVAQLHIEISVLTAPQELSFSSPQDLLAKLRPNFDGVILQVGRFSATFLPQVWRQIPDPEQFLNQLSYKAGLQPTAWQMDNAKVLTYQVEAFEEER